MNDSNMFPDAITPAEPPAEKVNAITACLKSLLLESEAIGLVKSALSIQLTIEIIAFETKNKKIRSRRQYLRVVRQTER
jgi:hypothetical protein